MPDYVADVFMTFHFYQPFDPLQGIACDPFEF